MWEEGGGRGQAPGWSGQVQMPSGGRGAGDGDEVGGQDAEADPALDTVAAMVGAAVEAVDPPQDTDAPFDAGAPAIAATEPALAGPAGVGRWSGVGQGDAPDPGLGGIAADGGGRAATIAGEQVRRAPERAAMPPDAAHDARGIRRGPIQDLGVGDDPAVGLGQPEP